MAIALSPRLAHDTGANGVFTGLAAAARASGGQAALECWWGERRCAAAWGEHARPDGYGRWTEQTPGQPPATVDFFLEYDTGTEPLTRVIGKLAGYAALAARTGITTPVLYWLRSPSREAALHARLAGPPPPGVPGAASAAQIPGVPVATAARGTVPGGPAGAAWLPAASPGPRLRLAQLAPPGTVQASGGPDGDAPDGSPGLPWHPPEPAPPAWNALPGETRPGQDDDD
jgi:Replication-relaxation